ncbi:hypothetical protein ALC56_04977 [Trachymyrmex septentrionalis]|uniref:Uncharacterized protein n=1 Tax=Trachymyrmex septentrionalis TaxID=34720 RepID=A0A195FJU1_9HYME|nr:hypothetical protein ALC56_04977 [Trachymyrmex septentrionalis]
MRHIATTALSVPETGEECGDFYKYEETKLARAFIRSIVPECIRAESLPEVVMLRFVSKSGIPWRVQSASAINLKIITKYYCDLQRFGIILLTTLVGLAWSAPAPAPRPLTLVSELKTPASTAKLTPLVAPIAPIATPVIAPVSRLAYAAPVFSQVSPYAYYSAPIAEIPSSYSIEQHGPVAVDLSKARVEVCVNWVKTIHARFSVARSTIHDTKFPVLRKAAENPCYVMTQCVVSLESESPSIRRGSGARKIVYRWCI